jgi:hypothetical protein
MNSRDALRSVWGWFFGGQGRGSVSDQPKATPRPASETARQLSAANDYELSAALRRLAPRERGYISAEDYEEITAEKLDERSIAGRRIIANVAAECRCAIDYRSGEQRVYFTKNPT